MFIFLLILFIIAVVIWAKTRNLFEMTGIQSFVRFLGVAVAFGIFTIIMAILSHISGKSPKLWANWQTYAGIAILAITVGTWLFAIYLCHSHLRVRKPIREDLPLDAIGKSSNKQNVFLIRENGIYKFMAIHNGSSEHGWAPATSSEVKAYDEGWVRIIRYQTVRPIANRRIVVDERKEYIFYVPDGGMVHLKSTFKKGTRS